MLKRHSNIIENHLTVLVSGTELSNLVPKLISNNVFTQEMIDRILTDPDWRIQAVSLYLEVRKRGPHAFSGLVRALMESGHENFGRMLLQAETADLSSSSYQRPYVLPLPPSPPTEDSPDSSPTHQCCIPHAQPCQLPEYMGPGLRDIFRENRPGPDDLVNLGVPTSSRVIVRHAETPQLPDGNFPLKYKMTSKPRGFALIINNIQFDDEEDYPFRNGAQRDEDMMKDLLEQLYFEVEPHTNKTKQEMTAIVERFSSKTEWNMMECACVVLMSHGREGESEEDTEIIGTDGLGFKTRDILSYFYNDACPQLRNKPKIFIFQSCRGALTDRGVEVELFNTSIKTSGHRTETDGRVTSKKTVRGRTRSDMFIAHPVPPGIKANRDRVYGAWFIQTIVDVFKNYACSLDIEDLFKMVDSEIKKMINSGEPNYQTVTTRTIGWNKRLYFNPGLYHINGQLVRESDTVTGMDVVDTPSVRQQVRKKEDLQCLTPKEDDDDDSTIGCFLCRPS